MKNTIKLLLAAALTGAALPSLHGIGITVAPSSYHTVQSTIPHYTSWSYQSGSNWTNPAYSGAPDALAWAKIAFAPDGSYYEHRDLWIEIDDYDYRGQSNEAFADSDFRFTLSETV